MPSILFWDNPGVRSHRSSPSLSQSPPPSVRAHRVVCTEELLHSVLARMDHDSEDESLWALAKDLKRQQEEDDDQERPHKASMCFRRAIRIVLYYARSQTTLHSTKYYKKCMDVALPCCVPQHVRTLAEYFQDLAAKALDDEDDKDIKHQDFSKRMPGRSMSVSSSSSNSGSSFNSSSSAMCARCGVEKRAMPVCAKCKAQAYCSIQCLKEHQIVHRQSCRSTSPSH